VAARAAFVLKDYASQNINRVCASGFSEIPEFVEKVLKSLRVVELSMPV